MLYTEKEKNEIERVRKVFEKHIRQLVDIGFPAPLNLGQFQRIGVLEVMVVSGHSKNIQCYIIQALITKTGSGLYPVAGVNIDRVDRYCQPHIADLIRPTAGICVPLRRTVKQEKITHPPKCQELKSASGTFLWLFCEFD